jgi:hypothetical protein
MKTLYTIVGMKHQNAEQFVRGLRHGEPLALIREPDNPHDHYAVEVRAQGRKIGYVKGSEARGLATFIDMKGTPPIGDQSGYSFVGKLVVGLNWPHVEVEE